MKKWSKKRIFGIWFLLFAILAVIVTAIPGTTYIDPETGKNTVYGTPAVVTMIASILGTYIIVQRHNEGKPLFRKPQFDKPSTSEDDFKKYQTQPFQYTTPKTHTEKKTQLDEVDGMEGHDFEYWCADLLKKNGFQNVEVTKGSGDQGVDVLAEKDGIKYAVQCKCYSKDLGNTPVQEVESGRVFYGCHVGAVMTNRYFTQGARDLAQKTGTLLWDRDHISRLLKA